MLLKRRFLVVTLFSAVALGGFACVEEPRPIVESVGEGGSEFESPEELGGAAGSGGKGVEVGGAAPSDSAGGSGDLPSEPTRHRSTAAELATRSRDAYQDNESGLIHRDTLLRWVSNWNTERPKTSTGDLVILQFGAAATALPYVVALPGIRSYLANDLLDLLQVRQNGIVAVGVSPAQGTEIDSYLRRYDIDPAEDVVLLASGTGESGDLAVLAQAWVTLRYWGFAHENLGILHGHVAELPESARTSVTLIPPADGTHRVPSLGRDHFTLLATVGTVQEALSTGKAVLDVRSDEAFAGAALSLSPGDNTCLAAAPLCSAAYAGRVPRAVHLALEHFVSEDHSKLRSLSEIDESLTSVGVEKGAEIIVYDDDGKQSAVVVFALLGVAGVPARWYASSFVEWSSLNASHPDPALRLLPNDSPWRTDFGTEIGLWSAADRGIRPIVVDPYALSADRVITQDRAYLESPSPLPGPGDGGSGCSVP